MALGAAFGGVGYGSLYTTCRRCRGGNGARVAGDGSRSARLRSGLLLPVLVSQHLVSLLTSLLSLGHTSTLGSHIKSHLLFTT
jgi:hypothetical protein